VRYGSIPRLSLLDRAKAQGTPGFSRRERSGRIRSLTRQVAENLFERKSRQAADEELHSHQCVPDLAATIILSTVPPRAFTLRGRVSEDYQIIIQNLVAERDALKEKCQQLQDLLDKLGRPPGHFYSPVVDVNDAHVINAVQGRLVAQRPLDAGIDADQMKAVLERLAVHHRSFSFSRRRDSAHRYYYDNPFFGCHDGSVLFSMLLEFRPRRIIEIGCGFSSALMLDANDHFFAGAMDLTLIDPQLEKVSLLFEPQGAAKATLLPHRVQDIPIELFDRLAPDDILFIDSSHVLKTGSDVNYYFFEILPRLKPGVLIHIHDILYPFEYLEDWVLSEKRSWNEAYALRAFLAYNDSFEVVYWNNFVFHRLADDLAKLMPLCIENEGGSIWLRRTQ
jgi:predicted O-methyltransferase YrrM